MITIEQTVEIPADRRLSLYLPKTVPSGRANIVLVVSREESSDDAPARFLSQTFPAIEELEAEAARKAEERQAYFEATGRDRIAELVNSFTHAPFAAIDGMEYQRSMRDEWPE